MGEIIGNFNEDKYTEYKNRTITAGLIIILIVLFQILLANLIVYQEYKFNIFKLTILCEEMPGYFALVNSNSELCICMDKERADTLSELKERSKEDMMDRNGRKDVYVEYIKIDRNGKLVFTERHIKNGIKDFYQECLNIALSSYINYY